MGPIGGMKKWLEEDRRTPLPSYLTPQDKDRLSKALLSNGMRSPLLWYTLNTSGLAAEDDKSAHILYPLLIEQRCSLPLSAIPESNYSITKPVFYGGAEKDYICVATAQISNLEKFCPNRTVHVYGGDHWIIWSHAEQINNDLAEWLKQIEKPEL
jgi:soluble epoxide hydrolase / lipid-phosphate phosphatase